LQLGVPIRGHLRHIWIHNIEFLFAYDRERAAAVISELFI